MAAVSPAQKEPDAAPFVRDTKRHTQNAQTAHRHRRWAVFVYAGVLCWLFVILFLVAPDQQNAYAERPVSCVWSFDASLRSPDHQTPDDQTPNQ
jgi:hypothetical protein